MNGEAPVYQTEPTHASISISRALRHPRTLRHASQRVRHVSQCPVPPWSKMLTKFVLGCFHSAIFWCRLPAANGCRRKRTDHSDFTEKTPPSRHREIDAASVGQGVGYKTYVLRRLILCPVAEDPLLVSTTASSKASVHRQLLQA